MPIVDEKGRLFGKINIIDLIVILFIVLVIIVGFKYLLSGSEQEYVPVYFKVDNVEPDIVESLKIGDVVFDSNGNEIAIINDLELLENHQLFVTADVLVINDKDIFIFENEYVLKANNKIKLETQSMVLNGEVILVNKTPITKLDNLTISVHISSNNLEDLLETEYIYDYFGNEIAKIERINSIVTSGTNKIVDMDIVIKTKRIGGERYFQGQSIRLSNSLRFLTDDLLFSGVIVEVKDEPTNSIPKEIKIKIYDIYPWLVDAMGVGDTELSQGKVNAEIIGIEIVPAEMIVETHTGEVYKRDHPVNKDVTLIVELQVEQRHDEYYFHNYKVKIGQEISLDLGDVEFTGMIIEV